MADQRSTPVDLDRRVSEHRRRPGVVLAVILACYLLVLIDVSILMAALPSIRADLGCSDTGLSWAQNAYTLTFGGLLVFGARAGDVLGRRRAFVLGIGVFTAASLAVAVRSRRCTPSLAPCRSPSCGVWA